MNNLLDLDKIATLPGFPGFYESILSSQCDREEEMIIENETSEEGREWSGRDPQDLADAIYWAADYSAAYLDVAREYVDSWSRHMRDAAGLNFGTFESMESPREYNFTTDRVFLTVPLSTLQAILDRVPRDMLRDCIREQFTSRAGFCSFYSNDLDNWLEKPLAEWDHNECGTLLAVAVAHYWQESEDIDMEIYYDISDCFYSAVENCIDWQKVAERMKEKETEE
jgi:hypothetical protein